MKDITYGVRCPKKTEKIRSGRAYTRVKETLRTDIALPNLKHRFQYRIMNSLNATNLFGDLDVGAVC